MMTSTLGTVHDFRATPPVSVSATGSKLGFSIDYLHRLRAKADITLPEGHFVYGFTCQVHL